MATNHIELSLYDAENALQFIDPAIPYIDWAKLGRSLYAEYGDDARDMFEQWSAQSSSYNAKEFLSHWRGFRKTRKTNFGSFIYMATEAGWKPERKELTAEEKAAFKREMENRKKAAAKRLQTEEQRQWAALEKEAALFASWPTVKDATGYMIEKHMIDLATFVDVRLGRDKFNNTVLVWPIYEGLFNTGRFCGFERILDKRVQVGKRKLNKFASDNAYTELGFATVGTFRDHGPKRVFVCGGLADAYAIHKSSGEVAATPIGEGNIPQLIQRLRQQHQDIEFIAAPDCDKTGRIMVERSGGQWTLPTTEGSDWSDTWINEGNQALVEQLTHIRGFEVVESNSRYLSAQIKQGLNLLHSDMGTGKSHSVKQFIKENPSMKVLVVSHRKELAKNLKADLSEIGVDVRFYLDEIINKPEPGVDSNIALRMAQVLVISVDSLYRLVGSNWDMVFVDEIEQNLMHYFAETNRFASQCLNMMNFLLTHSKVQVLADAHLGDLTMKFCNRIGLESGVVYKNTYQIGQGKKIFLFENKAHLCEETLQDFMTGKRRYVYANSKEEIKKLANMLRLEVERKHCEPRTLVVHAESVNQDPEISRILNDIKTEVTNIDIIMASPTLGTGFDIPKFGDKGDFGHQFDATVGILNSRVGTAEEGHQGLNRARNVDTFFVYVDPAQRSEPTDPAFIHEKLINEVSAETMQALDINPETGELMSHNELYEWLFCEVKAKQNVSSNDYRARFVNLAIQSGYEVITVSENKMAAKFGNEAREDAAERTNRELLRDIEKATVHTGEAFDLMMNNGEDYSPFEIIKSKVVKDLNLDDASAEETDAVLPLAIELYNQFKTEGVNHNQNPEADAPITLPANPHNAIINAITFKQQKSKFVGTVKNLALVKLSQRSASALDMKDIEHADNRVNWRHLSIRRRHLIKILSIAGIDADLNCSGKEWGAEDVSEKLVKWLKRKDTQDSLFKYSNVTVTANTLAEPLKWFHNYLRRNGVPTVSLGKRRINGVAMNFYGVDQELFETMRVLVDLRVRGIEQHMDHTEQTADSALLEREAQDFIATVEAGQLMVNWEVKYKRLQKAISKDDSLTFIGHRLEQVFAQINDLNNDPLAPSSYISQQVQSGSAKLELQDQENNDLQQNRGEEKSEQFTVHFPSTQNLSLTQKSEVEAVFEMAINEFKLPATFLADLLETDGAIAFVSGNPAAMAGTLRDIYEQSGTWKE